ncbi:ribulose-phosphate 3-epimerase [Treponema primitia]|uniref:ribulose-phosphate 3-epimerase n=1 Tax=Treponema primitia TaxID=88058 RepID=UPI0002554D47|nr:ribulose-phosphate 3-epimerase [Treponema primitia]
MLAPKLSPSMMCADLFYLRDTIDIFETNHIPYLHIDVMDGSFVPNLMLGTDMTRQIRRGSSIPLDIHLMIENPGEKLEWFLPQGGEYVSVHVETTRHLQRVLHKIRTLGAKPMVALNPATPLMTIEDVLPDVDAVLLMTVNPGFAGQKLIPQTLDKIKRLRTLLDDRGFAEVEIEVDGNVTLENALKMRSAGANIFVAGTSLLFRPGTSGEVSCGEIENHIKQFNESVQ